MTTNWPPKDWRAILALLFSIIGAVVLTAFLWWLCAMLLPGGADGWTAATESSRAGTLRWVAWITTGSIGLVLLGLGFAINRRSLSAKWGDKGLDWQGGDDQPATPAAAAQETAAAAERKAEQIARAQVDSPEDWPASPPPPQR